MSTTAVTKQMVCQGLTRVDVLQGGSLLKDRCVSKVVPRLEQLPPSQTSSSFEKGLITAKCSKELNKANILSDLN